MSSSSHRFTEAERAAVYRAIAERRDMRHFNQQPIDIAILQRLLMAAHQAPSVGLMQPWRMIRITDIAIRQQLKNIVETERLATAKALAEREDEFMRLKIDGLDNCAELIVVCLSDKRDVHIFGRRTLPQMDLASVACAIQNMWLAARAEGLGMGWVSLFAPEKVATLLGLPADAEAVAILCLGHVDDFYPEPMLQMENWATPQSLDTVLFENKWPSKS